MKKELTTSILIGLIIGISFVISGFSIGYSLGYMAGMEHTLNWGIEKAVLFLEVKGYTLEMNASEIARGIGMYKAQINHEWPTINWSPIIN